jgi:hypothetical protein
MSPLIEMPKPKLEVADILRRHIAEYRDAYPLGPDQHRVVSHLLHCRTPTLGGHMERCTHCGAERILYHSCRNRHCPKCQQIPRERWLERRKSELLPTTYFHLVFTLPHELNPIILKNKSVMLNILFKAVSQSLLKFGRNELGGKLGFIALLHTWDQQLKAHFHLHCLVPGGLSVQRANAGLHTRITTSSIKKPSPWFFVASSWITSDDPPGVET